MKNTMTLSVSPEELKILIKSVDDEFWAKNDDLGKAQDAAWAANRSEKSDQRTIEARAKLEAVHALSSRLKTMAALAKRRGKVRQK